MVACLIAACLALPTILRSVGLRGQFVELATSFHLQLTFAALFLFAVWSLVRLRYRAGSEIAVFTLVAGALNAIWVIPFAPGFTAKAALPPGSASNVIMVANVHFQNRHLAPFVAEAENTRPDILIMIEPSPYWVSRLDGLRAGYPYRIERPTDDRFGLTVWSKFTITDHMFHAVKGSEAPVLTLTLNVDGAAVRLAAIHPSPPLGDASYAARQAVLSWVADWASADPTIPTIVAGDLNTTPYSADFDDFIAASHLFDPRRQHGLVSTWPRPLPWPLRIPIDHVLGNARVDITGLRRGIANRSDHLPLIAEFRLTP